MQVVLHSGEPETAVAELLVLGVFQGEAGELASLKRIDRALGGALSEAMADEDFSGKSKQRLVVHTLKKLRPKRIALVGLGKRGDAAPQALVSLGGIAAKLGRDVGAKHAVVVLPPLNGAIDGAVALAARGARLGTYSYRRYKTDTNKKKPVQKLSFALGDPGRAKAAKDELGHAEVVSRAVALTRDLVNDAPIDLYPETFAARAKTLATAAGLKVKVYTPAELAKLGMNLLLGVGAGSSRAPRLVHLIYKPAGAATKKSRGPTVLVGKGITFDSGGLSLKSSANMEDMKVDMAGAASVLATMCALTELRPKIEVHGLLALAENMPSGTAIRPGDVIKSAAGKTVEVNNTDAEGRLVLADALHYARGLEPSRIVDLATLTGACVVALGPHTVGLFSNNDELAAALLASAKDVGESFWRMPLSPSLKDQLKSDVADMKNTGAREGGAITAALFLSEFVGETTWAHLDIAGPATSKSDGGPDSKGGTGVAVATLCDWLCG
jgi:leucyl aminopeptidase